MACDCLGHTNENPMLRCSIPLEYSWWHKQIENVFKTCSCSINPTSTPAEHNSAFYTWWIRNTKAVAPQKLRCLFNGDTKVFCKEVLKIICTCTKLHNYRITKCLGKYLSASAAAGAQKGAFDMWLCILHNSSFLFMFIFYQTNHKLQGHKINV